MSTRFDSRRRTPLNCFALGVGTALLALAEPVIAGTDDGYLTRRCEPLIQSPAAKYVDYNDPAAIETIRLVEHYHFTSEVENLVRGSTGTVPSDIAFVLRAIPNHYRALIAMGRWQIAHPMWLSSDTDVYSADCYFERAISFREDDPKLRMAYAIFLHQAGELEAAADQYSLAETMGGSGLDLDYNYGLLLVDMGRLAEAQAYADKVYAAGYPLPGLRNRLAKAQESANRRQ